MASAADVIELFLTDAEDRAQALAEQLHDLNKERQETEADIVRLIQEECCRVPVTDGDAALVFSGKAWHKGVVGIVASRVVERYHRPVFVLSEDEETGVASGSGRSIRQFHLLEALETMPELFTKFGGHRQAAGVTMPIEAVTEFRSRMNAWAGQRLTPDDYRPTLEFDAVIQLSELTDRAVAQVLALAPFGFGNSAPLFAVLDAEVAGPCAIKNERLITVPLRQDGRTLFVKAWGWNERLEELAPGARIHAALCIEEDTRSNFGTWCAVLKDVQSAEQAAAA
jgi:single-stranded-DNA-specific exonuclease